MEPCVVNCPLLTCISTSLPRSQKSTIWSFLCHKPPQVGLANQILFIQAIFKAARSFLCHIMSGEQILFYRGIPILRLGGEFARSARWPMMISQIETPRMMHVKPKTPIRADASEKRTAHLMEDFVAVYLLKSFF